MGIENSVDKVLFQNKTSSGEEVVFTAPVGKKTRITTIIVCNITTITQIVGVHWVQVGGTASDATVIGGKMVKLDGTDSDGGGGVYVFECTIPMLPGERIHISSSGADTLCVTIIGLEETL